jgi:hypothetical protein
MSSKNFAKQTILLGLFPLFIVLLSSCTSLPLEASMTSCPLQLAYGNVREDLGLVLTAKIYRAEGRIGEKIKCDVSLRNIKGRIERLSFTDGEYFVLTLFDQNGKKVWSTMPDLLIGGPSRDMVLESGDTIERSYLIPLEQVGEFQLNVSTTAKVPCPAGSDGYYFTGLSVNLTIRVR